MAWSAKERYVARNLAFLGLERGEHIVDGRSPAPVDVDSLVYPIIYNEFYTSQVVVWDFWTINPYVLKKGAGLCLFYTTSIIVICSMFFFEYC